MIQMIVDDRESEEVLVATNDQYKKMVTKTHYVTPAVEQNLS